MLDASLMLPVSNVRRCFACYLGPCFPVGLPQMLVSHRFRRKFWVPSIGLKSSHFVTHERLEKHMP